MSGGVDSAVAAVLMQDAGFDVIGVTLQLYDHGLATSRSGACCAGQDIHDARRVAAQLGIPHYVLDFEARFAETVMGAFADAYIAGETPIPCVTCNQRIKFSALLDTAGDLGADVLATGHYVQLRRGPDGPELFRAAEEERDQSYFLFATTPTQLARLAFPLGGMRKSEVRELARSRGLPIADKRDSQDICFVPTGRYGDVIGRLRPGALEPGDIVHEDGRVLSQHAGIVHYTVGQRRGLGLAAGEPLYVVRIDAATRRVIVGPRQSLYTRRLRLRDVNWIGERLGGDGRSVDAMAVFVRLRSAQPPRRAWLRLDGLSAEVLLADGEYGVAPGQACVFYADKSAGARVLGGGWIVSTEDVSASDVVGSPAMRFGAGDLGTETLRAV
jgi:tRNA-specific 2-thiouridylase